MLTSPATDEISFSWDAFFSLSARTVAQYQVTVIAHSISNHAYNKNVFPLDFLFSDKQNYILNNKSGGRVHYTSKYSNIIT